MNGQLVQRSDKVAFMGVPTTTTSEGTTTTTWTYYRMQGFTEMTKSLNPKEYSRQYVDEIFEQTDVVGYTPNFAYAFDMYKGNEIHDDLAKLADSEALGSDAVRPIIIVDFNDETSTTGSFNAVKRDFSIIPDSEGNGPDAYGYLGNMRVKGDKVLGTVVDATASTSETKWLKVTFTAAE